VGNHRNMDQTSPLRKKWSPLCQFPSSDGKLLLNLAPGEPFSLVKKFPCFDDPIDLYGLLVSSFHIFIHDFITCILLKEVMVDFCSVQVLRYL
jgi:hypothetical protein